MGQSVEPVLENAIKTLQKVVDVRNLCLDGLLYEINLQVHLLLETHVLVLMALVSIVDIFFKLFDARLHCTTMNVDSLLHFGEAGLQPLLCLLLTLASLLFLRFKRNLEFVNLMLNLFPRLLQLTEHELLLLLHFLLNGDQIFPYFADSVLYLMCTPFRREFEALVNVTKSLVEHL